MPDVTSMNRFASQKNPQQVLGVESHVSKDYEAHQGCPIQRRPGSTSEL